jgi:rod shape-determining protein MreC
MKLSQKTKVAIGGIILFSLLLAFNLNPIKKEVKNFFYFISHPFQEILWQWGKKISNFFETISAIERTKKENQDLKNQLHLLMAEKISLEELRKENEILREALGLGLQKEFKLKIAKVIAKEIGQDFILINQGASDGISLNAPVITPGKVLVGRISEVSKNFSKVQLISDKESTFDAKIAETEIPGVIKGKGNLKLFLDLVPPEKEVKEGELVVTTSLGGIYPAGLLVGKIGKIKKSDLSYFPEIEVLPLFDFKEIEFLFIIINF